MVPIKKFKNSTTKMIRPHKMNMKMCFFVTFEEIRAKFYLQQ